MNTSEMRHNYKLSRMQIAAAEKAPPHNVESERYIIGAVLHDPTCLPAVSEILGDNSFYVDRYRHIFDSCLDLHQLGESIDAANVVARLEYKGLAKDGDLSFLLEIEDRLLAPGKAALNGVACAKLVRRHALERKVRELGQRAIEKPSDVEKITIQIDEIKKELAALDGQAKDSWKIFTSSDAFVERPPLQYIIAGLFTFSSLSIGYGAPATLKSLLFVDAAVCVAGGIPFLGRPTIQSATMLIDLDNGERRTHERIEAILRARNLPETTPFFYTSMPSPWLNAGNLRDIEILTQRIRDRNIKFIVVDNLGLISGGADENSADMVQIMGNLRLLAERSEAAVLVIHHERKNVGTGARAGDAVRGHTSIEAALDLALQVEREPHSNVITIKSTKTRDIDVLPFGAEFRFEHKPRSEELASALFVHYEIEDNLSDNAIENAIKDALAASPLLNQAQLVDKVKEQGIEAGKNRIGPIANRMADRGRIVVNTGHKGSKLYSLA